ncbi:hypothetical protein [Paenibacillus polymyxa]|uniref:hypothetical protein n=1 Tax=Paenibacillus polymyxa TaxID=1406 RepID=UPI00287F80CB|nr:hypothetical protein [Paenibacillus polymyxa]
MEEVLRKDATIDHSRPFASLAEKMYNEAQEANLQKSPYLLKAERPLVFYYGFSYLAKGTALQKLGFYDQAREYILKYSE